MTKEFDSYVKKGITLIGTKGKGLDDDNLIKLLVSNEIPELEAIEIILFLPVAFCRKLVPEINWHHDYIDFYSKDKQITRLYNDNPRYLIIQSETENYWSQNPGSDTILNIAGRSAEFKAINNLLNDGGKLENIVVSQTFVVRYD